MKNNSYWRENNPNQKIFPKLKKNIRCDILIIGAGITGLATAYEMLSCSNDIVIVDQNKIYQNTTSATTAKVTYQHGYIYHDLIKKHGKDKAKLYKEFNEQGLMRIEEIVNKEQIDCDFKKVNSYLFALKEHELVNLQNENNAYKELNIPGTFTKISDRISKFQALKIPNQANFNVVKYLNKLVQVLENRNVQIFEDTKIVDVNKKKVLYAKADSNFTIIANKIIICSHYPVYKSFNFYFMKMIPQISYAALANKTSDFEDANYINTDSNNTVAVRYLNVDGVNQVLVSGQTHDTSKFYDTFDQINKLKAYGEQNFDITEYDYTWTGMDYCSTDLIPYIGKVKNNIYIAVAFNEWGMTTSHAAAILIKDLIINGDSKFKSLFDPCRVKPTTKLLCYNTKMIVTLIKTRIFPQAKTWKLSRNTGKVIKYKGKPIGIYKDENGKIYVVRAICPHMHCGLRFNPIDKTYDCKCHGSRFKYDGKKIDGPSNHDLDQIDIGFIDDEVIE